MTIGLVGTTMNMVNYFLEFKVFETDKMYAEAFVEFKCFAGARSQKTC